jgi:hypothetical protein
VESWSVSERVTCSEVPSGIHDTCFIFTLISSFIDGIFITNIFVITNIIIINVVITISD